jgi:hypothetical protein
MEKLKSISSGTIYLTISLTAHKINRFEKTYTSLSDLYRFGMEHAMRKTCQNGMFYALRLYRVICHWCFKFFKIEGG